MGVCHVLLWLVVTYPSGACGTSLRGRNDATNWMGTRQQIVLMDRALQNRRSENEKFLEDSRELGQEHPDSITLTRELTSQHTASRLATSWLVQGST